MLKIEGPPPLLPNNRFNLGLLPLRLKAIQVVIIERHGLAVGYDLNGGGHLRQLAVDGAKNLVPTDYTLKALDQGVRVKAPFDEHGATGAVRVAVRLL